MQHGHWRLPALTAHLAVILLFTIGPRLHAQSPVLPAPPLLGAGPGPFIALSVANLDRMVAWYRDTLGFSVFAQGTVRQRNIRYALLKQDRALLEILQWPEARSLKQAAPATSDPVEIHGFFKSGVVVTDLQAVHDRLHALGVAFDYELQEHPGGYRSFGVRDPEGNLLQIFGM